LCFRDVDGDCDIDDLPGADGFLLLDDGIRHRCRQVNWTLEG
jgi:hypothetical protein